MPLTASLRTALSERVVVADGAMGTMLQRFDLGLDDFEQHEGCNEILSVTRPDVVGEIHDAYLEVGADAVLTNTFGANFANLGEYGISDRIYELSLAGARIARAAADRWSTDEHPRWVLGSMGPGTKLPTLGHTTYAGAARRLPGAGPRHGRGRDRRRAGGDSAGPAAVQGGGHRRQAGDRPGARGRPRAGRALIVNVTVEATGTMLMGSEIGAALTALEPLGIDVIGLNCATGPTEMSEHLRYLSRHAGIAVGCMPNAGLPQLTADGAHYPLTPEELADAHDAFTREFGLALVGGCCGTTPEHIRQVVDRVRGRQLSHGRSSASRGARRCTSTSPSVRTRRTSRSASGQTPTAPRRSAWRCSRNAGTTASTSPRRRSATAPTCWT
jgi:5-methyltetrahydrofolate--homocysteine methyltransferase